METQRQLTEQEAAVPRIVEAVQRYEERRAQIAPPTGQIALEGAEIATPEPPQIIE